MIMTYAPSDEDLLALYAQGDRAAARALTARFAGRVLGYVARMLGDYAEAEDIAQEAMLRLWQVARDWRVGEAKVSTWLYTVAGNLARDRLRVHKRRQTGPLDDAVDAQDEQPAALERMMTNERLTALDAALNTLPTRQRQAVILRHIEGLTNPEIASVMGIGVEAVESLTARGKRALHLHLMGQRARLGYEEAS